ncbi:hypothetical protein LCGC14_1998230 [marine sediment metagenome]|uniref:Uncharacterized protein n=1 Tax=marine sediment metagenome TaxID=412755 RepID=A0A0F9FRU5_9ZZZZ
MAIASFQLDPNAQALTDDQVIAKINAATTDITRAGSVDPSARPIEALEVGTSELAANAVTNAKAEATLAKDNLNAMADTARGYIRTVPVTGEFPVVNVQRDASGLLDVDYDDVAII